MGLPFPIATLPPSVPLISVTYVRVRGYNYYSRSGQQSECCLYQLVGIPGTYRAGFHMVHFDIYIETHYKICEYIY